ncbi:MAG: ATP-binding cassette domain-containing protein [Thermodesulfovibrionales bacterium]
MENTKKEKEQPLVSLQQVDVVLQGKRVLSDLTWRMHPGEQWALIGSNGAGKSTFLRLVRGDIGPYPGGGGRRAYALNGGEQESPIGIKRHIALVSAELQEAYTKNGWDLSGEEVVGTGLFDTAWLYETPTSSQREAIRQALHLVKGEHLGLKSILSMSQGEARRVLIARALVARPRILLLDEFLNGLDIPSRRRLMDAAEAAAQAGAAILSTTHRSEELLPSTTHVLCLHDGKITAQGRREDVPTRRNLPEAHRKSAAGRPAAPRSAEGIPLREGRRAEPFLIRISHADLYRDDRKVLDSVTWRMNWGENWAVLGRNGSGKSSLLKLIAGELHPAAGGNIRRFGGGERWSLREIRKRVHSVSPDIQAEYRYDITGEEAVLSGFFGSIGLYDPVTQAQREEARRWMELFSLEGLGGKKMDEMSYGEQRKILIARAMVTAPDLLLLDEPCSGLDAGARADLLRILGRISSSSTGTALLLVTHHLDELIPSISHVMVLEKGRIAAQGKKEELLQGEKPAGLLEIDR